MPRKEQGWITFQASQEERDILEQMCRRSQRTKTEILRELVRGLDQDTPRSLKSKSNKKQPKKYTRSNFINTIEVNSCNIIQGVVTQVLRLGENTQLTLKINPEIELTSVITNAVADELELIEGIEAYAVINSNNIVIAKKKLNHWRSNASKGNFNKGKSKTINNQLINV
ncbi:TOBE domain-containing protein [Nostoc sp. FACHB-110]|nr:TOBE domain-containing protein [Nostoc sp. FACHB-110]